MRISLLISLALLLPIPVSAIFVDVVYQRPNDCKELGEVSVTDVTDQQLAIDKLASRVKRERGDTLLVLEITPYEVLIDHKRIRTRYDSKGLAFDCDR